MIRGEMWFWKRERRRRTVRFSVRATIGATVTNVSAANFGSAHALPVAFGYLKIIEKQQPKYVDKLTPHITKLLQKLIKDHTSAGVDYNPGKLPLGTIAIQRYSFASLVR